MLCVETKHGKASALANQMTRLRHKRGRAIRQVGGDNRKQEQETTA